MLKLKSGKNLKREKKSGAGQVERSVREQDIMETWSFLTQHIVRNKTFASEEVTSLDFYTVMPKYKDC